MLGPWLAGGRPQMKKKNLLQGNNNIDRLHLLLDLDSEEGIAIN